MRTIKVQGKEINENDAKELALKKVREAMREIQLDRNANNKLRFAIAIADLKSAARLLEKLIPET